MRARGFTLVEVMVALAIVAIALPALLMALYQQVDDTAYLRDKSLASMVAANKLAELRIVAEATQGLSTGKDGGVAEMADRDWYWWLEKQSTEVANFLRVEIRVAADEEQRDQPLYTLVAFLSTDLRSQSDEASGEEADADTDTGEKADTRGTPPGAGQADA